MAKFHSEYKSLMLQDNESLWAQFENGEFETTDTKLAARLRKEASEWCTEVKAAKTADKPADVPPADAPTVTPAAS